MKHYKLPLLFVCVFLSFLQLSLAQEAILTSGGNTSGAEGSISYSFGQMIVVQQNSPNGSILPGVQQPYEITTLSSTFNADIDFSIEINPNPTSDFLIISLSKEGATKKSFSYQILDLLGNVLESQPLYFESTRIDLSQFANSVCLIRISDEINNSKTFKIIKK